MNETLREFFLGKGLSNREAEVAAIMVKGISNKEAADKLFVTEKTIKFHLTNAYKKLPAKNKSQLIVLGMRHLSPVQECDISVDVADAAALPVGLA